MPPATRDHATRPSRFLILRAWAGGISPETTRHATHLLTCHNTLITMARNDINPRLLNIKLNVTYHGTCHRLAGTRK
jgi:hypothetical protein